MGATALMKARCHLPKSRVFGNCHLGPAAPESAKKTPRGGHVFLTGSRVFRHWLFLTFARQPRPTGTGIECRKRCAPGSAPNAQLIEPNRLLPEELTELGETFTPTKCVAVRIVSVRLPRTWVQAWVQLRAILVDFWDV